MLRNNAVFGLSCTKRTHRRLTRFRQWASPPLALLLLATCPSLLAAVPAEPPLVIRHVNVLPMDRDVLLRDQRVIVQSGLIEDIRPDDSSAVAPRATVLDGTDKFLIPGLVDFHTHPNATTEMITYAYYGITTIATFDGEPLDWRLSETKLSAPSPHLLSTTKILDGPKGSFRHYAIAAAAHVPEILDSQIRLGAVMAKTYSYITDPAFQAIVAAAHERGLPVVGHVPIYLPMEEVLGHGLDLVAHSEELTHYLDSSSRQVDYDRVVHAMSSSGISLIPNLSAISHIPDQAQHLQEVLARPEIQFMSSSMYQEWSSRTNLYANRKNVPAFVKAIEEQYAVQERVVGLLNQAGVPLLAGTDAPDTCLPGECLSAELELLRKAGLTDFQALRTATFNPGLFVAGQLRRRMATRFGVIAPGAVADLVLLGSNPLNDVVAATRDIRGIAISGHWWTSEQLSSMRKQLLPELRQRRALVDQYETLMAAGNVVGTMSFLDGLSKSVRGPLFSEDTVPSDAKQLALQDPSSGLRLLRAAQPYMKDCLGVHNALAALELMSGNKQAARGEYEKSLAIAPFNQVALDGLNSLGAGGR
jgi:imidazolonepropionase-like amidohydrolase